MREVSEVLFEGLVGVDNCIHEFGRNLIVEVPRSEVDKAVAVLGKHFPDVVDIRKAYQMVDVLHDFIMVKPMHFAIFWPWDGHQPCVGEGNWKKLVVKIKL